MPPSHPRQVGRYLICDQIGAGGMAAIHIGRMRGPYGFSRTVAIKRLHPQFAQNPQFVAMFTDEARLAVRIRHANVISTIDVVVAGSELFIVMEYVNGESLSTLLQTSHEPLSPTLASAIVGQALLGLHAAHEATAEDGTPLAMVHRDASPQNILVGHDGVARVLDFGIAKAAARSQMTEQGKLKGKLGYLAPEQLSAAPAVDRRTDLFTMGIVLWEALTGGSLFGADSLPASALLVLQADVVPPSAFSPNVSPELDALVLRALARDPGGRYADALSMAIALQKVVAPASHLDVSQWVERWMGDTLVRNAELVRRIEALPFEDDSGGQLPAAVDPPDHTSPTAYKPRSSAPGKTELLPLPSRGEEDIYEHGAIASRRRAVSLPIEAPRARAAVPGRATLARPTIVKAGVLALVLAGAVAAIWVRRNPTAGDGASADRPDRPERLDQRRDRAGVAQAYPDSIPTPPPKVAPPAPAQLEVQTPPPPASEVASEGAAPPRRPVWHRRLDQRHAASAKTQHGSSTTELAEVRSPTNAAGPERASQPPVSGPDDLDNPVLRSRKRP